MDEMGGLALDTERLFVISPTPANDKASGGY
jgi:hypothetical protein